MFLFFLNNFVFKSSYALLSHHVSQTSVTALWTNDLETSFSLEWWPQCPPLTSHVPLVYSESLQRGNCGELPMAYQATSIHQHKSAQRGANCVRRPWLFAVARACVGERERPCGWRERCLKKSGSDSAWSLSQASPLSPLQLLAACPVPSHKQTHKCEAPITTILWISHVVSVVLQRVQSTALYTQICVDAGETKLWIRTSLRIQPFSLS